jgi:hypothetical protein
VAERAAVAGGPGGGAGIQTLRPARARLITAVGALACLVGAEAYATATAGRFADLTLGIGGLAVALLAVGLVLRWRSLIPWSVLVAAGGYLSAREGKSAVDGWAAVVGVLLLLAAELASWSIEHSVLVKTEPGLVARRAGTLAALVAVALFVNLLLLAAATVSASAGVLLAAVGVAASVAAVAVVLRLLRT